MPSFNTKLACIAIVLFALLATYSSATSPGAPEAPRAPASTQVDAAARNATGGGHAGHSDPFSPVLMELALIVAVAAIGRRAADRVGQPPVLGELLIGVLLGNVGYWLGRPFFILVMHLGDATPLFAEIWRSGQSVAQAATHVFTAEDLAPGGLGAEIVRVMTGRTGPQLEIMGLSLWIFSNLGVILLLFMVGLESSVREMLRVGPRAAVVAVVGVVAPFGMGLATSMWLLPDAQLPVHLFLGATLCATSVGITARVFKDLQRLQTAEAKIILGAAVIDDILGLIILAVVVGIVATGELHVLEIGRISLYSVAFLGIIMAFGDRFIRILVPMVVRVERRHTKLLLPLALAFTLSWLADLVGLASIVGAFAAGLILSEEHFADYFKESATMAQNVAPLEAIFAPIFFVLMGMQVRLDTFLQPVTLSLSVLFTIVAVIGKLVAGFVAGRRTDALTVGIGMVPRGEVGLIFASAGKSLGVVTDAVFSALVIVVIATTLITPLGLKWSLARRRSASEA
jgi:Na+:H+ antiporter